MLGNVIGDLLPTAVGVAISPVPIVAVILMLGTPKARTNGPAFALGWIVGLTVVSVVVLLVAGGSGDGDSGTSTAVDLIVGLLGLLLLYMALKQFRGRPRRGEEPTMPKWMSLIDSFTPAKSFGFGALLSGVNPKNLALTLAAAASIAQAGLNGGEEAVAVAVFVALGSVTVAGPVILYLVMGSRAAPALASMKEWLADNNAVIMSVVLLILGAKLLGSGISGLTD